MKYVYFFGTGTADGGRDDRELLGGKGADLAEMARLGLNVPPGFTVTTEACLLYLEHGDMPDDVRDEIEEELSRLEELRDRRLGDAEAPLLLSVRSGAVVSMPGMMDTVLDLGCNPDVVEGPAELSGERRFALDTYRRLVQMFTNVVQGLRLDEFEEILDRGVEQEGVDSDADLPAGRLEDVVDAFLQTYRDHVGGDFPTDPVAQGEDVVAGVRTPRPISRDQEGGDGVEALEDRLPGACRRRRGPPAAQAAHAAARDDGARGEADGGRTSDGDDP